MEEVNQIMPMEVLTHYLILYLVLVVVLPSEVGCLVEELLFIEARRRIGTL
jgi:hypothetical protein